MFGVAKNPVKVEEKKALIFRHLRKAEKRGPKVIFSATPTTVNLPALTPAAPISALPPSPILRLTHIPSAWNELSQEDEAVRMENAL